MSRDEGNCYLKETNPEGEPTIGSGYDGDAASGGDAASDGDAALESTHCISIDEAVPKLRPWRKANVCGRRAASCQICPCTGPTNMFLCFVSFLFSA